jgi:hypothetical protein
MGFSVGILKDVCCVVWMCDCCRKKFVGEEVGLEEVKGIRESEELSRKSLKSWPLFDSFVS